MVSHPYKYPCIFPFKSFHLSCSTVEHHEKQLDCRDGQIYWWTRRNPWVQPVCAEEYKERSAYRPNKEASRRDGKATKIRYYDYKESGTKYDAEVLGRVGRTEDYVEEKQSWNVVYCEAGGAQVRATMFQDRRQQTIEWEFPLRSSWKNNFCVTCVHNVHKLIIQTSDYELSRKKQLF